ncbi:MAG: hypothetical protein ABFS32_10005, partial [Bacteroidota bacterium]
MATQENKPPVKRQFLFNPLKRPMPYVGLMLAVLIIIFQGTLRITIADLVGSWLVSNIKESTQGMYTIKYDIVRFDIFTKELRIQNFDLDLDTTVTNEDEYLNEHTNLVDISTPVVVLKLESLWDLIINDKLKIAYIGMQEPRVNLIRSESLSQEESLIKQQEASERVRSYLEELEIDSFRILNGTVDVNLQSSQRKEIIGFKIRDFSTLLRGFRLDEIRADKLLQGIHAEVLELEVKDQEITMPDLEHELRFNRLWLSTKDSVLLIDTLKINPSVGSKAEINTHFDVLEFTLNGIDFRKLYENLELDAKHLYLKNPDLAFNTNQQDFLADNSQITFDNAPFNKLKISEIAIDSGSADLRLKQKLSNELFNCKIYDLQLDSTDLVQRKVAQKFNNFNFETFNNVIELPDSIHELKIGYIKISTKDSVILANNARINPISSRRKYSLYRDQGVKHITYGTAQNVFLNGIEFNELLNNQQLLADSIILISPNLNITEYPYIRPKSETEEISPFLIHHVIFANGNINYNKRQNSQDHRTVLQNVNIDINNLYPDGKKIAYDNLDASIRNGFNELKQIGHTVRFEDLRTNNLSNISIARLQIEPDSASIVGEKINLDASGIQTRGLAFDELRNSRKTKINSLAINSIDFKGDYRIRRKNNQESSIRDIVEIHQLNLDKGDFTFTDNANTMSMAGITVFTDSVVYNNTPDSLNISPVDFHELLLTYSQFSYKSNDGKTAFSGQFGSFSESDSLIKASGINFKHININGSLNRIVLKGLDRHALFSREGLQFNYLLAEKPNITVNESYSKQSKTSFNADSVRTLLLDNFSYIQFDSVFARGADMIVKSGSRTTHFNKINTYVRNYRFDSTSTSRELITPGELKITV